MAAYISGLGGVIGWVGAFLVIIMYLIFSSPCILKLFFTLVKSDCNAIPGYYCIHIYPPSVSPALRWESKAEIQAKPSTTARAKTMLKGPLEPEAMPTKAARKSIPVI